MCYHFRSFNNNDPMFPTIDATYVIHLKGNGRYPQVEAQLNEYAFTKDVHIIINDGYKKCSKPDVDSSVKDLIDAYLFCFRDAQKYDNVLILEDDFIVREDIRDHTKNVNTFVRNHSDFVYRLGCNPSIMIPYDQNNYVGLSGGTHAVVYSKSMREKILQDDPDHINDWDHYITFSSLNYLYYKPLIYQLYPETENQKNWGKYNPFMKLLCLFSVWKLKLLKMDKQVEPGFSIMYLFAKWWLVIVAVILLSFVLKRKRK